MLNFTKISATLLALSLSATAAVRSEEVSLESLIGSMLTQSAASVKQELNNNIQGAVLTAANQFSIYEEETYFTSISITDLDTKMEKIEKHKAE